MKENKLVDLSMDFSVKIIKLCEAIKGHYSLVNQLEKSDTLSREVAVDLYNLCGTIRRILIASINTTKENMK